MTDAERQQQRAVEFLRLMPLTLELAGLPKAETGKYYSEDQIEVRAITIRKAYKAARQLLAEMAAQP
jgi:hypothetical protein